MKTQELKQIVLVGDEHIEVMIAHLLTLPYQEQRRYLIDRVEKEHIATLLQQVELRKDALKKCSYAETWWFTRKAMEQATSESIAEYKASLVNSGDVVLVGCAGVGCEVEALLKTASCVIAIEKDDLVGAMLKTNNPDAKVRIEALEDTPREVLARCTMAFLDPDRRDAGRRHVLLEDYLPNPLEIVPILLESIPIVYTKVSPMLGIDHLPRELCVKELYFIEEKGVLKEVGLLSSGEPSQDEPTRKVISINEYGVSDFVFTPTSKSAQLEKPQLGMLLYDPSVAVIKSKGYHYHARCYDMALCDGQGSVLFSHTYHQELEPWYGIYRITRIERYEPKRLRRVLKNEGISTLVVRKRHFELEPDQVRKQLKLAEGGQFVYAMTCQKERLLVFVEPYEA